VTKPVSLYRPDLRPFLQLNQLLAMPRPDGRTRTFIPAPGQFLQAPQQPTGIIVRLEHRTDGLFLVMAGQDGSGGDLTYPVIAQPMPRQRWHSAQPCRYMLRDSTGHNVRILLLHIPSGGIGSRHELEAAHIYVHSSRDLKPSAREQRRLDKLFAGLPIPHRRPDILNFRNSIAKLMTYRPYDMERRTWMRLILTARYGWRGERLETETTGHLMDYNHRKWNRAKWRPHFHRILGLNQERARLKLEAEPLPVSWLLSP
jgi:hypothetical protein